MRQRLKPNIRKQQILDAAIVLSQEVGYTNIRRDVLATKAGVADALVSRYWGTMPQLKNSIVKFAIASNDYVILMQAIAANDPLVKSLSTSAKREVFAANV